MPMWICVAFESEIKDSREMLRAEYDGLTLYIRPNMNEADQIAVFCHIDSDSEQIRLKVNRFLSAMAWKDGMGYRALGSGGAGALLSQRDNPMFCFGARREFAYCSISRYDFDHLQNPPDPNQKLGLALYREGLATNNPLYKFLSFYKIINILHSTSAGQKAWINTNLSGLTDSAAITRLQQLNGTQSDIGHYLSHENRNAIAHAFGKPIRDPDIPGDLQLIYQDIRLMRALAELFIEQELGVPSMRTIRREHLYELAGFKSILGEEIVTRLKTGASLTVEDLPNFPALSLRLKEKQAYPCLENLHFVIERCENGKIVLATQPEPIGARLLLDVPNETLEFGPASLGVDRDHTAYNAAAEICVYQFLLDYLKNGSLEVFDARGCSRLSLKNPYLPRNIDLPATIRELEGKIVELRNLSVIS
jgi:hypothetical protein